ncbi:glycerol dehydratase reactivase beta/small subunit family protein [Amycolatopsis sp.]|uniref:glycerol dehydratase reactivase beta/small subunit family protein n=1 Tax=Amycolatopsis sp. TaxID=37632 RepID=UPI002BE0B12B|nr:glycerol dehydratase reactivase beta/small subunit family protein [Amycolatopsis sp.]HVV09424.1 glycerol dehydratase reactivase beta/small subunit family protein [Amycolatopsis sp.]
MPERPAVVVYCAQPCLREILAGLEEEGVPARVELRDDMDATTLAFLAAQESALDVGIGADTSGAVCVHHAKLPPSCPALLAPAAQARRLGHNAARLVTRIPFKTP